MIGDFDAEKNRFVLVQEDADNNKLELSHKELEQLLEKKLYSATKIISDIHIITTLLNKYPILIKD